MEKHNVSPIDERSTFSLIFIHLLDLLRVCLHWVFDCGLDSMNNSALIPVYTQHNLSSMKLRFRGKLRWFILVIPLPFELNIVIKDSFLVIYNVIFEEQ